MSLHNIFLVANPEHSTIFKEFWEDKQIDTDSLVGIDDPTILIVLDSACDNPACETFCVYWKSVQTQRISVLLFENVIFLGELFETF